MRTGASVLLALTCAWLGACGSDDVEPGTTARHTIERYLAAGRAGDVETLVAEIHPDERAFFGWERGVSYVANALSADDGWDDLDFARAEAVRADFEAHKAKYDVPGFDESSEDIPNPASMETVIEVVDREMGGVDPAAVIRDAVRLFEGHGYAWHGFDEYRLVRVDSVVEIEGEALVVLDGSPEPVLWLTNDEDRWYVRVRPPPLWLVEKWRSRLR